MPWLSVLGLLFAAALPDMVAAHSSNFEALSPGGAGDRASDTREGGESYHDALVIGALPYFDSGATCDNINDITPSCSYSSAPDVVYRYTPTVNMSLTFGTCGSTFDTILEVQRDNGVSIVCNDDYCDLQSQVSVDLVGGQTYYFIIDGYNTACGTYVLRIDDCCATPGACCFVDGSCEVLDAAICVQEGGTHQGVGTMCEPNPCGPVHVERASWGRIKSAYR